MTIRLLAMALLAASPVHAQEQKETVAGAVNFGNGDRLSGRVIGIDQEGYLLWKSDTLHKEVPLGIDQILDMSLRHQQAPPSATNHVAKITLTNGDTVKGELLSLDEKHVTLKTDYGCELTIRRSMSSNLEITKAERAIYTGPNDVANWTISEGESGAWSIENGHLVSHQGASVARELDLPEKVRISFELAWRSSLRLRLLLLSDDGGTAQPNNCYDLVCNRRFVYLRKRWINGNSPGSRIIGQSANIRELAEKEKAHFDFYLDRKSGTIALYVDGQQAQVWNDDEPKNGQFGNWLHFISEDGYPIRVSRLRVSEWTSGKLPDGLRNESQEEEIEEEGQRLHLQNGDVLVGEIGEVKDGLLEVTTQHTPIKVPIERMRTVKLTNRADPAYEEPKRVKGDIRAWFRDGGRLTFRLESFQDGVLTGTSQTFGEAHFDLSSFSRIEFNIYSEKFKSLRNESSW